MRPGTRQNIEGRGHRFHSVMVRRGFAAAPPATDAPPSSVGTPPDSAAFRIPVSWLTLRASDPGHVRFFISEAGSRSVPAGNIMHWRRPRGGHRLLTLQELISRFHSADDLVMFCQIGLDDLLI